MIRNLPNNYTREMLLQLMDSQGFSGQYDFVYLPMDFNSTASLGYAFVNLVVHANAKRFWACFDGWSKWTIPTKKKSHVTWGHPVQGLTANLERYRNSPVMHAAVPDEYKPVQFLNGRRVPFPPPTKKIQLPRLRAPYTKGKARQGEVMHVLSQNCFLPPYAFPMMWSVVNLPLPDV